MKNNKALDKALDTHRMMFHSLNVCTFSICGLSSPLVTLPSSCRLYESRLYVQRSWIKVNEVARSLRASVRTIVCLDVHLQDIVICGIDNHWRGGMLSVPCI